MGNLPTARTETVVAGAAVSHNLINEIQDNIIANHSQLVAVKTILVPISASAIGGGATVQAVSLTGPPGGATSNWFSQIPGLTVGETIVAVRARVTDNATGPTKMIVALYHIQSSGALSIADLGSAQSAGTGAIQSIAATGSILVTATTEYIASVSVNSGNAACTLTALEVDVLPRYV